MQPEDDKDIFNVVLENDLFANEDRDYTNGIRFAWLSSETRAPAWVKWSADNFLPLASDGKKRISVAAGQSLFTPSDLKSFAPLPNDRPYAGWLYGSVGVLSDTGATLDNVLLTVGIVGPQAYGEQTQKFIHTAIMGKTYPNGWRNQLKNELGIDLSYERKWRSIYQASPFGIGFDLTPHAGFNIGNVYTDAIVGGTVRLGYDLPMDYGPPRIRPSLPGSDFFLPSQDFGGYLFAGIEGRGVGRNIFLDGNTFAESQSVDKKWFVGSAQLGATLTYNQARLSYTHVFLTKEFDQQKRPEQFGVITASYRF